MFGLNLAHLCPYTIQARADAIQEAIDPVFRPQRRNGPFREQASQFENKAHEPFLVVNPNLLDRPEIRCLGAAKLLACVRSRACYSMKLMNDGSELLDLGGDCV